MISVCMATYNGERFIEPQLDSILKNLSSEDEVIISDDGSTDATVSIITKYMKEDHRIKLLEGPKRGLVANFENALRHSTGQYIFLSDQDDIWSNSKVSVIMRCFKETGATMVVHDCNIIDEEGNIINSSFFDLRNSASGFVHNLIKNSYIGCCMAFKKELLNVALPIPSDIPWHDEWLGLINEMIGETIFLPDILFSYRRHGDNVSSMKHSSIKNMIVTRYIFLKELLKKSNELRNYKWKKKRKN